jgi:hypothetical protein
MNVLLSKESSENTILFYLMLQKHGKSITTPRQLELSTR